MWDAFQREILGAMGHTVLVPAVLVPAESQVVAPAASAAPLAPVPPIAPVARRAPAVASGPQPALLRALALAAGSDDLALRIVLPPLAQLRTPAAKRQLWPRLRALRKTPPA